MSEIAQLTHGQAMLQRAEWAAEAYGQYDYERVIGIVRAVAEAGYSAAQRFAEEAVQETGFGNVDDKLLKNQRQSRGFVENYGHLDFCTHRVDAEKKLVLSPRPAGVVFALTPSTGPVATVYFKALMSLLTRNAIVISPHPAAAKVSVAAAKLLADAAIRAGAPENLIQVIEKPTVPLIEALMKDQRAKLILATGGSAVVRAAYRSGTPALGVGPGNPPVLVDETADLARVAKDLVTAKSFDNSVNCTAESVLIVVESAASRLLDLLRREGAHVCTGEETEKLRAYMYPGGKFNTAVVGKSAQVIAKSAGIRVGADVKVLFAPFDEVVSKEPFTHEKLSPVLGLLRVPDFGSGVKAAEALLRIVGAGHSAVIHSESPQRVLDFTTALPVHRISVNVPGSQGSSGVGTNLPTTMSAGTGFEGGCSTGDNLSPEHLVQWNRAAYSSDPAVSFPDFTSLTPRSASEITSSTRSGGARSMGDGDVERDDFRQELRRIVLEELRDLLGAQ